MVAEQPERFRSNFSSSCLLEVKILLRRALSAISLTALESTLSILGGTLAGCLGAIVLLRLLELIFGLFFKSTWLTFSLAAWFSYVLETGPESLLNCALIDSAILYFSYFFFISSASFLALFSSAFLKF